MASRTSADDVAIRLLLSFLGSFVLLPCIVPLLLSLCFLHLVSTSFLSLCFVVPTILVNFTDILWP